MQAWWNSLTLLGQVFVAIAVPASVVMIIQSLLLFFGIGFSHDTGYDGHDTDTHDGSDGLNLITVRGMVAFFSVGGWTGLVLINSTLPEYAIILIAFAAGTLSLIGIAMLFKLSMKLQDKGNLDIGNAINKTGKVYIPIPPNETGQGKITILVQERLIEIQAMTRGSRVLKTGEIVTVSGLVDDETVMVESLGEKGGNK
jgi:hypothetical protein